MTDRCPIKCRFCGAECSPENKEQLTFDDIRKTVDSLMEYKKLKLVVFTGGEPLLLKDTLLRSIGYCSDLGIHTRVVTNAFWAIDFESAIKNIVLLKKSGLKEINISCDDYHQEFIPLDNIKYANQAAIEENIPCLIGHKIMKGCRITKEFLDEFLGTDMSVFDPQSNDNPDFNLISSGYTVPIEKDMHLIPDEEILYPETTDHWKGPCSSILQQVIINSKKELCICCGMIPKKVSEVCFGNLDEKPLEFLINEANNDLIVNWLALEGPYGLMNFIKKKDNAIQFRTNYVNNCHLCSEIFTRDECREILLKHANEKTNEIMLERIFYDFMRDTTAGGIIAMRGVPDEAGSSAL